MTDSSGMRAGLKGNVEEALRLFASEADWAGLNLAETEFVLEETLKCYGATFDGEMIRELSAEGVRVPGGFATTAAAYRHFIAAHQLGGLQLTQKVAGVGSFRECASATVGARP